MVFEGALASIALHCIDKALFKGGRLGNTRSIEWKCKESGEGRGGIRILHRGRGGNK